MFTLLFSLAASHPRPIPAAPPHPGLVVLVAVDQFRGDYFARFATQYTGGLARLAKRGAVFAHAMQDHALTETAPGHSTMLSGRDPAHTGIVNNTRGVGDATAPLIGARGLGASPRLFNGTTLYDWMHAADSATRVLSVSRKDRGAILPVGRAPAAVYWYADGGFTTSTYYAKTLPDWVQAYNARRGPQRLAGASWSLLLPPAAYAEPDSVPYENGGVDFVFPHRMSASSDTAALRLASYPWMDSLTLDLALDGVRTLDLGRRGHTDLLVVSLSTTDAVGHAYGPDSREVHDQLLRLDRWLGRFLDSLDKTEPAGYVLAMTADHGVTPLPEHTTAVLHHPAGRVWFGDVSRRVNTALQTQFHAAFGLEFEGGLMLADTTALAARGIDVDSLANSIVAEVRTRPGVTNVYTPRSLVNADPADINAARWRRQIPPSYAWLVAGALAPGYSWSGGRSGADHGTTNDDDVTVPIVFMGRGIPARKYDRRIRTVDIAPTLAAYLGIEPAEKLDGIAVREILPNH